MTIFCNQFFLALNDVTVVALTDASVKVVLYKRCTFCPVFFALSTTEEASHSWGETFGRSEASKAGVLETIGRNYSVVHLTCYSKFLRVQHFLSVVRYGEELSDVCCCGSASSY